MRKLEITEENLKMLDKTKPVGFGAEGVVYNIGNGMCVKLLFNSDTQRPVASSSLGFNAKGLEQTVTLLAEREQPILTDLPIGLVYCNGKAIGSILHYHENTQSLGKLLEANNDNNLKNTIKALKSLISAAYELGNLGINDRDLTLRNVLVDENGISHIIDLDNLYVDIEDNDELIFDKIKEQLDAIMKKFIYSRSDVFTQKQILHLRNFLREYAQDEDGYFYFLEEYISEYNKSISGEFEEEYDYSKRSNDNYYDEYLTYKDDDEFGVQDNFGDNYGDFRR